MGLARLRDQGKPAGLCGKRQGGYPLQMSNSFPRDATAAAREPPSRSDAARFIRERLPLAPVPGAPEISLHQATPSSGLWRLAERGGGRFGSPYWAYCWGGGLALARHVLDRPETAAGRRALDLGAGSGLVGIAAAMAGARTAIASEVDPYACAALRLNAAANGIAFAEVVGDLTAGPPPDVDLVLVGDLFYDADLAARVIAFLERCADAGLDVLIGDPWRAYLPRPRLRLLAEYRVADFGAGATASGVFALARS
jgi:predicted nicotinamide N-methyase